MTMLDDLMTDAQVSEKLALESINAAADALSGSFDELAHLTAAEDLLEHSRTVRSIIDEFWANVPDNAWSWDANDIVSVKF